MKTDIQANLIGLISVLISLFAIYFPDYQIIILSLYTITLVGYILFVYISRIEEHEKEIIKLKESFKRAEDLIDIKAEIKSLGRKNEQ